MSEHKQKVKPKTAKMTKKINNDQKTNDIIIPILPDEEMEMKPLTQKLIKNFVNSLFDNERENKNKKMNNTCSSSQHKKTSIIKHKEEILSQSKHKDKDNKKQKTEKSNNKKKNARNQTSSKVKKSNSVFPKDDININLDNKKNKKFSFTVNPHTPNYKPKKENNKNNKIIHTTESNVRTANNKETIGEKMLKDELAKEKKECAEKLRIIKEHILSLQKKEEELSKKMINLNKKENALAKKIALGKNNESDKVPIQTEINIKEKKNDKNNDEFNKNIKINFEAEHKFDNKEKEKEKIEKSEEKKNEKTKTVENSSKKHLVKKKKDNKENKENKRGKTPEKKMKKTRLVTKIVNSRSDKKIPYPMKRAKVNHSVEVTKKTKDKIVKKNK